MSAAPCTFKLSGILEHPNVHPHIIVWYGSHFSFCLKMIATRHRCKEMGMSMSCLPFSGPLQGTLIVLHPMWVRPAREGYFPLQGKREGKNKFPFVKGREKGNFNRCSLVHLPLYWLHWMDIQNYFTLLKRKTVSL